MNNMGIEHKQIERIADNVQTILDSELKSAKKYTELEKKFNNLQNTMFNPNNTYFEDSNETRAFGDYLRKGIMSEMITKSLSTATGEAGVAIVNEINRKIIYELSVGSVMRQLASVETVSTSSLDFIVEDGRFTSGWVGDADERPVTDNPTLKKKSIPVHELYAQPKATQKLMDDSAIDLNSWLAERLADAFIKAENEAFITGNGTKKPKGLLTEDTITKIDVGATVTADNLLLLINSLPEGYLANASFLMNRKTLSVIQGLKDAAGRFIWQPSLSDPLKQSIFGIPVFCSSHMPDIGENNLAIAVGDFKAAYKIVDRENITIMRDPYTDKPFIKFYAVKRVGGDVVLPAAVKFAKFQAAEA